MIELLARLRKECNIDENGDPVGAQPERGWETGYCAGIRTVYRILKESARTEERGREHLLNQIIDMCARLDDCSAGYMAERIRDDFLIGKNDLQTTPQEQR